MSGDWSSDVCSSDLFAIFLGFEEVLHLTPLILYSCDRQATSNYMREPAPPPQQHKRDDRLYRIRVLRSKSGSYLSIHLHACGAIDFVRVYMYVQFCVEATWFFEGIPLCFSVHIKLASTKSHRALASNKRSYTPHPYLFSSPYAPMLPCLSTALLHVVGSSRDSLNG